MQWDESLSIGVPLIDGQHKEWVQRFNDVAAAVQSGQAPNRIMETLDFLSEYTQFHFEAEERCMADHHYPELDEHKQRHQELRQTLKQLEVDFDEEGVAPTLARAIDTLLSKWLVRHIREVDQRLGTFLKERGIVVSQS